MYAYVNCASAAIRHDCHCDAIVETCSFKFDTRHRPHCCVQVAIVYISMLLTYALWDSVRFASTNNRKKTIFVVIHHHDLSPFGIHDHHCHHESSVNPVCHTHYQHHYHNYQHCCHHHQHQHHHHCHSNAHNCSSVAISLSDCGFDCMQFAALSLHRSIVARCLAVFLLYR